MAAADWVRRFHPRPSRSGNHASPASAIAAAASSDAPGARSAASGADGNGSPESIRRRQASENADSVRSGSKAVLSSMPWQGSQCRYVDQAMAAAAASSSMAENSQGQRRCRFGSDGSSDSYMEPPAARVSNDRTPSGAVVRPGTASYRNGWRHWPPRT